MRLHDNARHNVERRRAGVVADINLVSMIRKDFYSLLVEASVVTLGLTVESAVRVDASQDCRARGGSDAFSRYS